MYFGVNTVVWPFYVLKSEDEKMYVNFSCLLIFYFQTCEQWKLVNKVNI
jgi:hypothetical protein